ncbi:MAG: PQQ-dependent sugar dehydrogenase [Gammaproteobacteria bacterium]|nr:MAG: PQQ-dependent sugar dehydrogenase [Gammaproteobacteria bacterium]
MKAIRGPLVAAALAAACTGAAAPPPIEFQTERAWVRVVTIAQGLEHPWGLAFLPDGRMLVTERPGRLRLVAADGSLSAPLAGVPEVVARGQGGLLDVTLDPAFAENGRIYFAYAEPRGGDTNATAVARARLSAGRLDELTVIFRQQPAVDSAAHFGSRLVFAGDGRLFVTLGERSARGFRERAQDLDNHFGKVVRIEGDGTVPADNPFVDRPEALPEIWSYGHRNVQGAALHPLTGELWTTEHGPRGGDELNITRPGRNYGWPVITYGREYTGLPLGEGSAKPGLEQPLHYWVPSIGSCGLAFYTADRIPGWQGSVFVGGLKDRLLVRLELDASGQVLREERLFAELEERIRDVRQGPDGLLYLLTDSPQGRILRVEPL